MSDGITDAKRECKPIRYTSSHINPAPQRCQNCIFITRNPHDNQWECTNPLQHGQCDEPNNCAFHITLDELAIYTRERLKSKLIGESMVECNMRCKFYVESESYGTCKNMNWHHNGSYRCNCEGDTSKCKFWKDKSIGESNMLDKTPRCKHVLDDGRCSNIDGFECPFVSMWDIAGKVCRAYEFMPRKFNIVDTSGDYMTPISGPFDSEEEALDYIKSYIKVEEVV